MRNVTMSGLGKASILVEAGERSGTRIQARAAVEHGRAVILTDVVVNPCSATGCGAKRRSASRTPPPRGRIRSSTGWTRRQSPRSTTESKSRPWRRRHRRSSRRWRLTISTSPSRTSFPTSPGPRGRRQAAAPHLATSVLFALGEHGAAADQVHGHLRRHTNWIPARVRRCHGSRYRLGGQRGRTD